MMTAARPILPWQTYLVTRRATNRMFLLLPDSVIEDVTGYLLALAAKRFGVLIHGYVFNINHYHLVVTDVRRNVPEFYEFLNRNVARVLNIHHGRRENFWEAPGQTHLAPKLTPDEALAAIVYTVLNPVKDGLVAEAQHWEGTISHTRSFKGDSRVTFKRPELYFRADNPNWPDEVTLELTKPPGVEGVSEEDFYNLVCDYVRQGEKKVQQEMDEKGMGFIGVDRLRRLSPEDRATSTPKPRRRGRPRGPSFQRDRYDWLGRWRKAYERARELLLSGAKAVFPVGTYWMRRFVGVVVGDSPAPPPNPLNPWQGASSPTAEPVACLGAATASLPRPPPDDPPSVLVP